MDNTSHDHQDDSSALDGKKTSHLEETIKNHEQHQDQTLPNISPQSENFRKPHSPLSMRKYISWPRFNKNNSLTMWSHAFAGRVRLYSESQVYTVSRWQDAEPQDGAPAEENGGAGDGLPFRGRSQSAPAALWKAKKYGRQLRRMSDEFDTWLDKGVSQLCVYAKCISIWWLVVLNMWYMYFLYCF